MGCGGKYTRVNEGVQEIKRVKREVYMPLVHHPGEAQVDFGYALVKVAGHLREMGFFVMAFEQECTESYWEGHVGAFEFFDGVPNRISYDNTRVCW